MNPNEVMFEILSRASGEGLPDQIGPEDTLGRIAVCAELVDAGYLTGHVTLGSDGRPVNVAGARITASGRERLRELIEARDQQKSWSVAKRRIQWVWRWIILPLALAVFGGWLIKKFGFK
jgi:hypothetical protein